jgi:spore coat polysaccharide biosynthesis protein SpsF
MVDRMRRAECCDHIVLATTTDPRNEPLVEFAIKEGLGVVREDAEDDLAARIAAAVRLAEADLVLKVAGDCPLIDPDTMRAMVARALHEDSDFCSNRVRWTFPIGLSCDVLSARSVLWCDENLVKEEDRELFAVWIRDHPEQFKVVSFENATDLSSYAWTVDTPEDYDEVAKIFEALYRAGECFSLSDVLGYVRGKDLRREATP